MDTYTETESKKDLNKWKKDALGFLLNSDNHKDIAIKAYSKFLDLGETVEFTYNGCYYEIFESADSGYIVNLYSSDKKDEDDCYLDKYNIDGGLCTGSAKDAIEFMM